MWADPQRGGRLADALPNIDGALFSTPQFG